MSFVLRMKWVIIFKSEMKWMDMWYEYVGNEEWGLKIWNDTIFKKNWNWIGLIWVMESIDSNKKNGHLWLDLSQNSDWFKLEMPLFNITYLIWIKGDSNQADRGKCLKICIILRYNFDSNQIFKTLCDLN